MVEPLGDRLAGYFHFHGLKGALLQELGRTAEARSAFDRAIALANSPAEAAHIRTHLDRLMQDGDAAARASEVQTPHAAPCRPARPAFVLRAAELQRNPRPKTEFLPELSRPARGSFVLEPYSQGGSPWQPKRRQATAKAAKVPADRGKAPTSGSCRHARGAGRHVPYLHGRRRYPRLRVLRACLRRQGDVSPSARREGPHHARSSAFERRLADAVRPLSRARASAQAAAGRSRCT